MWIAAIGGNGQSSVEGALWNFNFSTEAVDGNDDPVSLNNYNIDLLYDFDLGAGTALGDLGSIDIDRGLALALIRSPASPRVRRTSTSDSSRRACLAS